MSGGSGQTTTTGSARPPQEQQDAINFGISELQNIYQQGLQFFGGLAPLQPTEIEGAEGLADFARGGAQQTTDVALASLRDALSGGVSPESQQRFGAFGDVLAGRIGDDFSQRILPHIREESIEAGQFGGSSRFKFENQAAQGAVREIADARTKLASDAFTQRIQSRDRALGLFPQTVAAGALPSSLLSASGAFFRGDEQSRIDLQNAGFNFDQFAPLAILAQLMQAAGTGLGQETTATTDSPESLFQRIFGGIV